MTQHSPTKWLAVDADCHIQWPSDYLTIEDEEGGIVAKVYCYINPETTRDNARKLAAAPELLAACKAFLKIFEDGSHYDHRNPYTRPEVKAAISAIAKAEGREP